MAKPRKVNPTTATVRLTANPNHRQNVQGKPEVRNGQFWVLLEVRVRTEEPK